MASKVGRDREFKWLPLAKIIPNERNPRGRRDFNREELLDLERSIKQHGILEPMIVQPYKDDLHVLIEGERRWTVANHLGLKEVPVMVVKRLPGDDQVVVMYNLHENRKGWEMASHLRAIKELMDAKPDQAEDQLARELGLSLATFRDRLRVLGMGDRVVEDIAAGRVDYTSALRSAQAATAISKKRPELAERLGGEKKIADALIRKAKSTGGISHELTAGKQDLTDTKHVPDEIIEEYLTNTEAKLREVRQAHAPADQRRKVEDLSKTVGRLEDELRSLQGADFTEAPNLVRLRMVLRGMIEAASALEAKISDAIIAAQVAPQTDTAPPKPPRRKGRRRNAEPKPDPMREAEERIRQETLDKAGIEPIGSR